MTTSKAKKLYRNLIENWSMAIEDGFPTLATDYSEEAKKLRARYPECDEPYNEEEEVNH